MRFAPMILAALLAVAPALPAAAQDQQQDARFALEIRGLTIGELTYAATETGSRYSISGQLRTSGLAGMLRKMGYSARVQGSMNARGFFPGRYDQSGGSGNRVTEETVVWQAGMPRIERQQPPRTARDTDADPTRQRGTIDTLTTLYVTLRDVPRGQECKTNVIMYDGRYRMQLRVAAPKADGEKVSCSGEYIRLAGFSAEEMAERTRFPFTVHYAPLGEDRLRVTQVSMDSLYGRARLVRR